MDNFNDWQNGQEQNKEQNQQQNQNLNQEQSQNQALNQDLYQKPDYYNFRTAGSLNRTAKKTRGHKFRTYMSLILVTAIVSSTAVGGVLYYRFTGELSKQAATIQTILAAQNASKTSTGQIQNSTPVVASYSGDFSVVDIVKKTAPSIVGIRMTITSRGGFFGGSYQSTAEGSGIIISKDGYIMTNYHVVQYADPKSSASSGTALEVFLPDGRQAKAKFIGGDSTNDLAVVKVDLNNLPVAELGDSSKLQVGEPAVAIGNPLGMEFAGSTTQGIISALNRTVQTDDKTLTLIQTDAAINPGNSGGALVNSQGQVIGINTIKISETGVEGLGFAIPINDAKPIVDQLIMFGYVKGRPFMGISGQEVTDIISQQYGLPVGLYITSVTPESGADNAGIKQGDVLVSLAGKNVASMSDIDAIKKKYKAGDSVDAVIVRNGNKMNIKITFSEDR